MSGFHAVLNMSMIGRRTCSSFSSALRISSMTGDSETPRRIHMPIAIRTSEKRNGILQPQLRNCSSDVARDTTVRTTVAISMPSGTPICGKPPNRPRFLTGACSTAMSAAPPHSPPAARPWRMRSRSRAIGATTPAPAYVGRRPITKVAIPMRRRVTTSMALRPSLSP